MEAAGVSVAQCPAGKHGLELRGEEGQARRRERNSQCNEMGLACRAGQVPEHQASEQGRSKPGRAPAAQKRSGVASEGIRPGRRGVLATPGDSSGALAALVSGPPLDRLTASSSRYPSRSLRVTMPCQDGKGRTRGAP